ncbi:protein-arginine deiminase type-2-like isoform X1 [Oxyura jamaicensis]|uniref:protein-arginine deiminase type-2-like isoform X1 n=1 Tax=Oxyura jamaicensis TaxID=8884 RepID=UPI0015A5D80F|nr:protein-arginine deiminase type-2-like isoform X1 [Oxyura jamaicensis]
MPGERTLRLQHGSRIQALCVLGTHLAVDVHGAAPAGAVTFGVKHTEGVSVELAARGRAEVGPAPSGTRWPLDEGMVLRFSMSRASTEVNDNKVIVSFYAEGGQPIDQAGVFLTGIGLSLDVDADRDGVVEKNNPNKASWTWGPEGHGAILLVSCDRESPLSPAPDCDDERVFSKEDLLDMSRMVLRTEGPQHLPRGYEIVLYVPVSDADKVGVFHVQNPFFGQRYVHVLGRRKLCHAVQHAGGAAELNFFVEGLRFPDDSFPGLVSIHVSLLETLAEGVPHTPIFTDTVVFRVAPWIMTPSTLAPVNVFVCSVKDNYLFIKEVKNLVNKAGCDLKVCFGYINRGDRWMQDEIEFGYTQAPHKSFPVVLDSPQDRGLEQSPIKELLGPDFGYVSREPLFEAVSSLDSFGNLEVSPPVAVAGKEFPLGRILVGSSFPTPAGRRMTRVVRDFLFAQQVQAPVELYSDWLAVGHVNEFVTFVPSPDTKRFRMLMASPAACYKLFREKQKEGQGEATMFKGYSGMDTKRVTINKVLSNNIMVQQNQYVQRCIDWNRDILKKELGLTEEDIIDLPALFKLDKQGPHDHPGQGPGHPQALRPSGGRRMLPGAPRPQPPGAPGSAVPLPRGRRLLPREARGGALRHQRPAPALCLLLVACHTVAAPPPWPVGTFLACVAFISVN